VDGRDKPGHDESDKNGSWSAGRLLAVALEYLLTGGAQSLPILQQALVHRSIVAQLLSAKTGSVASTRLLLLGSPLLSESKRQAGKE